MPDQVVAVGGITGGTVSYLQRVKTGDYEHKEASVTLSFSVAEGYDYHYFLDKVADDVESKAREILHLVAPDKKASRPPVIAKTAVVAAVAEAAAKPQENASPLAGLLPVQEVPVTKGPRPNVMVKTTDPAIVEEAKAVQNIAAIMPEEPAEKDEWEDIPASKPAVEITDKMLTDAASAKNRDILATGKIGAEAIRGLAAKFAPPPGRLRDIPQAKRQEFLDALKLLEGTLHSKA